MKKVLLAEDDLDDQEIFREAVNQIASDIQLVIVDNGANLLDYVNTLGESELPDLIVLDQNMPRLKGNETIHALRQHDRYRHIPAVIYTTYHDASFAKDCDNLGIELFLKPDTFDRFTEMIKDLISRY